MLGTSRISVLDASNEGSLITSFFFARSPEAPSNTRMVFSCISRGADILLRARLVDAQCGPVSLIIGWYQAQTQSMLEYRNWMKRELIWNNTERLGWITMLRAWHD